MGAHGLGHDMCLQRHGNVATVSHGSAVIFMYSDCGNTL